MQTNLIRLSRRSLTRVLAMACVGGLAVAASLALAAAPAPQDSKSLKGAVRADGSSTVYPLAEAIAE